MVAPINEYTKAQYKLAETAEYLQWGLDYGTPHIYFRKILKRLLEAQGKLLEACNNDTELARYLIDKAHKKNKYSRES